MSYYFLQLSVSTVRIASLISLSCACSALVIHIQVFNIAYYAHQNLELYANFNAILRLHFPSGGSTGVLCNHCQLKLVTNHRTNSN